MDINEMKAYLQNREPTLMDATGKYAVLVPLVERAGELCLLYEVRAASLRRQPGEVCFPGGRMEPSETPEECALRESWEELGIRPSAVQILGRLDFIAHRANFILYPVLAKVEVLEDLRPSPAEVEEVFFVPVEHLLAHPPLEYSYTLIPTPPESFPYKLIGIPRSYRWQRGGEDVQIYSWEGRAIWGLTGRITRHLASLLRQET